VRFCTQRTEASIAIDAVEEETMDVAPYSLPSALGARDAVYATEIMADVAPDWSVELHKTFSGEASLMLMPAAADDAIGPTFVLHQQDGAVRLAQYQWDVYCELGSYGSLSAALHAVRGLVAGLAHPPSLARH
jgi:hypothetical protein